MELPNFNMIMHVGEGKTFSWSTVCPAKGRSLRDHYVWISQLFWYICSLSALIVTVMHSLWWWYDYSTNNTLVENLDKRCRMYCSRLTGCQCRSRTAVYSRLRYKKPEDCSVVSGCRSATDIATPAQQGEILFAEYCWQLGLLSPKHHIKQ